MALLWNDLGLELWAWGSGQRFGHIWSVPFPALNQFSHLKMTHPSIHPPIQPSIHPPTHLSIHPSILPPTHPFIHSFSNSILSVYCVLTLAVSRGGKQSHSQEKFCGKWSRQVSGQSEGLEWTCGAWYDGGTERRRVWLEQSEQGREWRRVSLARSSRTRSGITLWENFWVPMVYCTRVLFWSSRQWVGVISICSLLLFFFNWSIVDLQCCASLCCTAKWLSYTHICVWVYIYIHIYICIYIHSSFHIPFYYGLSQEIGYSSLCYTVGSCCYPF